MKRTPRRWLGAWSVLGMVALGGCSFFGMSKVDRDKLASGYREAALTYRLTNENFHGTWTRLTTGTRLVAYHGEPVEYAEHAIGTLRIDYPHPARGPAWARVSFEALTPAGDADRFSVTLPGSSPDGDEQCWELAIPRAELDALFAELAEAGYFSRGFPEVPAARLITTVDGARVDQRWDDVPHLNQLMHRAWLYGRPVGKDNRPRFAQRPPGGPVRPPVAGPPNQPLPYHPPVAGRPAPGAARFHPVPSSPAGGPFSRLPVIQ